MPRALRSLAQFERFNAAIAGRPDLMGDRKSITLSDGMDGILENTFLNIKNRSKTIDAKVDLKGKDHGIILCQGGKFGGWALYMNNGVPEYTYNYFGLEKYTVKGTKALPAGKVDIKLQFNYDGGGTGKGGESILYVNGEEVARGKVVKTQPGVFSADETVDVGLDDATQVADHVFNSVKESHFTGFVDEVTVTIP